jgi:hypothetical protein
VTARRETTAARLKARASSRARKEKPEEEYERSARDERTRKYADALAALRGFVRAKCHVGSEAFGRTFGELLTAWVEDAVRRGWIRVSEGGYAAVGLPEQWAIKDVPFELGEPEWLPEVTRRQKADQSEVMRDPVRLSKRVADNDEESALEQILRLPEMQHAALRALGVPMVEPGMLETLEAARLAADLGMIGNASVAGSVPEEMLERVNPLLRTFRGEAPTWQVALMTAVQAAATQKLEPRGKVQWVLDALKLYVTEDVPSAFSQSSEAQRTAAADFMRTLRLGTLKKEYRPAGLKTGRGAPLSARGAAAGFARCFGVRMEAKGSRAKRGKN